MSADLLEFHLKDNTAEKNEKLEYKCSFSLILISVPIAMVTNT